MAKTGAVRKKKKKKHSYSENVAKTLIILAFILDK